jgi:hypothetical protein
MVQVYCLECRKRIGDRELICPHCSCPIDDTVAAAVGAKVGVRAVESPVQKLKALLLISSTTLGLSILILVSTPGEAGNGLWMVSGAAGLGGLISAGIGLWLKRQ